MSIQEVLDRIIKEVTPSDSEAKKAKDLQKRLLSSISDKRIAPMFCGSIAKDTWLAGSKDVDLFLLFDEKEDRSILEEVGIETAKKMVESLEGRWEIAYAEHPYLKAVVDGHSIDIVPAYKTERPEELKSSVDRTPHHVAYVKKHMSKNLSDNVRLLKKFCKSCGVYGSDLKTEGLSGYLCELLIIHYKNFENLLNSAREWEPGHAIDIESHYKNSKTLKEKFKEPLVVIDPVDAGRNVASVLSAEKFFKLKECAAKFLKDPSIEFFRERRLMMNPGDMKRMVKDRGTSFIMIKFDSPKAHQDVVWPQMRKLASHLKIYLEKEDFEVLRTGVWSDRADCIVMLEMLVDALPKIQKRVGPGIMDTQNSSGFRSRYKDCHVFIEDGKWVAEYPRRFKHAINLIADLLKGDYDELRERGVPSTIAKIIHEDVHVSTGDDIYHLIMRNDDFAYYMSDYLRRNV